MLQHSYICVLTYVHISIMRALFQIILYVTVHCALISRPPVLIVTMSKYIQLYKFEHLRVSFSHRPPVEALDRLHC